MKLFHCDNCGQPVFFENTKCLKCDHTLGYLPDQGRLSALVPSSSSSWTSVASQLQSHIYRMCQNYNQAQVCNWMVPVDSTEPLCIACRLNRTIPDLSQDDHMACWSRLEAAKRRLVYSLLALGLPLKNKQDDPKDGLAFDFLADGDPDFTESSQVITGHDDGLITINIAEADDAVREKMRLDMNERYRTVLGHFRHEVGHYYWQILLRDSKQLNAFRALFGDEQQDYGAKLEQYYNNGAPAGWQDHYISAYASSHPWEDWAETWAHYLHIVDTLETAQAFSLTVPAEESIVSVEPSDPIRPCDAEFSRLINQWIPLTFALNSINRSMGIEDLYPFVLSTSVIDKLRFVHQVISGHGAE